jgi:hypothetical protein
VFVCVQYHALPELVLEETKPTVLHRVNERTLSPVQEAGQHLEDLSHPCAGSLLLCLHKAQVGTTATPGLWSWAVC